jgi:hypothetical protein
MIFSISHSVRFHHNAKGCGPNGFVERVTAILEMTLDAILCEAGRLPPDLRSDIKAVVTLYRRSRDTAKSSNKP